MKKQCVVCEKEKKINYKVSQGQDICTACLRLSPALKTQIIAVNDVFVRDAQTPQDMNKLLNDEESARAVLNTTVQDTQKHLTEKVRKDLMQQSILSKVQELYLQEKKEILPKEMLQKINKTIEGFNSFHLEDCFETVETATSFEDIRKHISHKKIKDSIDIPDPKVLYDKITKGVINQEHAVRTIASAIVKHYCRMKEPSIKKQNIFILGPTGTGKTELVRTLAKEIDIPLVTIDATSLTASGYRGNTASELIVSSVLKASNHDLKLAKYSIVFIDEIDKKAAGGMNGSDIGTVNVQHELLKMIEGGVIHTEIVNPITNQRQDVALDTSNILFIVAGAFSGLEKIINAKQIKRVGLNNSQDLDPISSDDFSRIDNKHLMQFGLIPEFIGRFSVITYTKPLDTGALIKILTKEHGLLDQYKKTFAQFKCDVHFSPEFLAEVAEDSLAENIGARGLERIFVRKMETILFNIYDYIGESIVILSQGKIGQRKKISSPNKESITF